MSKKTYKKRFVFLRHDETYTLTATALKFIQRNVIKIDVNYHNIQLHSGE